MDEKNRGGHPRPVYTIFMILGLLVAVAILIVLISGTRSLGDDINNIKTNTQNIDTSFAEVKGTLNGMDSSMHELHDEISDTDALIEALDGKVSKQNEDEAETSDGDDVQIVREWIDGSDMRTKEETYTRLLETASATPPNFSDIVNQVYNPDYPILIDMTGDGRVMVFYGRLDENGYWVGDWIVNIFDKDLLIAVSEISYENSKMVGFRQIYEEKNSSGEAIWHYADKTLTADGNIGETLNYYKTSNYERAGSPVSSLNIEPKDIVSVDDFKNAVCLQIEEYYRGETHEVVTDDGTTTMLYDDDSGNAVLVKYRRCDDNKSRVSMFYVGRLKSGALNDAPNGNSWEIVVSDDYHTYVCNEGSFVDNSAVVKAAGRPGLSLAEIEDKISGIDVPVPLDWIEEYLRTDN